MEKIDVKDRKILYQLDIDSRQSFRSIGRKVGLSKDVVASRVKKLKENDVIKNFHTVIDRCKLGYVSYRFYFNLQYVTPEIREEIIDYFVKNKYVRFVSSTEGHYDLTLILYVKDVSKCYSVWEKILSKYRDYLANQVFSVLCQTSVYCYSFLLDEKDEERANRIKYTLFSGGKIVEIDDMDYQLLKEIAKNARMPTIEIAKKLNTTAVTINNRINKLMKSGVIKAFRVGINFPKLGYKIFKTDIVLKDHNKLSKIIEYIKRNPNLYEIIQSIGYTDIELVFILNSANQLHEIITDLSKKIPDTIKNYTYFGVTKNHKWDFMPEE
jgi:Lrp/AsnC family transcriptional regulator for asnA, asnC and gidA